MGRRITVPTTVGESNGVVSESLIGDNANTTTEGAATAAPNPFDPESLRLPSDFSAAVGVAKAVLSIPVRKPDKTWFVRAHPSPEYRLQTCVVELKEDRESYLVARPLWGELSTEATFKPKLFVT